MITLDVLEAIRDGKEVEYSLDGKSWCTLSSEFVLSKYLLCIHRWRVKKVSKIVMVYPALLLLSNNTYDMSTRLFKNQQDAEDFFKNYSLKVIRLLTDRGVEVIEE